MTDWSAVDAKLTDPSFYTTGQHDALFAQLRVEAPVRWVDGDAPRPFWSFHRYFDCVRILEDAQTFSSRLGTFMPSTAEEPTPEEMYRNGYGSIPTHTDPPRHNLLRRPLNKHFSAPAVAKLRDKVQRCVDAIIDEVAPLRECDLVEDVAAQLPVRLICEMMGVPPADRPAIRQHCGAFLNAEDPAYQIDGDEHHTRLTAMGSIHKYMLDLAMQRREQPAEDFTSIIGTMQVEGQPMSDRDIGWWAFSIVAAGLESTRNGLSTGLRQFMLEPDQAARLRADPGLAMLAAEEIVRFVTPTKHRFRIATADVEVSGAKIRKGDWIMCWLVSANRDEAVFDAPDRFDIGRNPNPHLGFGIGEHVCLGRQLARLEMALMLNAVVQRLPDMEIAGEPVWIASTNHTGLKSLPVRFTPAEARIAEAGS